MQFDRAVWEAAKPVLSVLVDAPPALGRTSTADDAEDLSQDWQLLSDLLLSDRPETWNANQVARLEDLLEVMREELHADLSGPNLAALWQVERWAVVQCRVLNAGQVPGVATPATEPALV